MLVVIFYGEEIKQNGKIQKVIKNIGLFLIATVLSVLVLLFYAYIYNDIILKNVDGGELLLLVKAAVPPVGVVEICAFIFFLGYFFKKTKVLKTGIYLLSTYIIIGLIAYAVSYGIYQFKTNYDDVVVKKAVMQKVREKFPQYEGVPDIEVVEGVRKKFFSNMDKKHFYREISKDPIGLKYYYMTFFVIFLLAGIAFTYFPVELARFLKKILPRKKSKSKEVALEEVNIKPITKTDKSINKELNMEKFNITKQDRIAIYCFMIGLLFILYLWSGGIYEYSDNTGFEIRTNKVTGNLEVYRYEKDEWEKY